LQETVHKTALQSFDYLLYALEIWLTGLSPFKSGQQNSCPLFFIQNELEKYIAN